MDDDPSKVTIRGVGPSVADGVILAVGGWFSSDCPVTIIGVEVVSVAPWLSVTVSDALNVPANVYWCEAEEPVAVWLPSPKFQRYELIAPSASWD